MPLEGLWAPQPGRELSVVNGPKAFVGVDKRLPPGDGGQRQARAEEDNGDREGEPRSNRCGEFQSGSCRAANLQDPSPCPSKVARREKTRKDRRIGSAGLAGNSGFCPSPDLPAPSSRRKPSSDCRSPQTGVERVGHGEEMRGKPPPKLHRPESLGSNSLRPQKNASTERQPLVVVGTPSVSRESLMQFARGSSDQNRIARPLLFW